MKKLIEMICVCAIVVMAALPALANRLSEPDDVVQDQCTPEKKTPVYNEFRQNLKSDQAKAYELAKKWLACPEVAGEEQITPYLKNFVALYEKASRKDQITDLVYNKKDFAKAFEMGKAVLADEPENLKVLIDLAYAGYASKSATYNTETLAYAKKAIQLIESGKTQDNWNPYTSKDEALGYLYNAIGSLTVQKDAAEGLTALIKAAQFEGKIKKGPFTYGTIAGAYEAGPYAKLSADYKAKFEGKDETPESKLALENINQVVDRMIDAYARAVALAGNDPANQAAKKEWMDSLSTWYKYRHNQTDAGMNELLAGILAKPLPPEPTPLTTLPASVSTTSPASGANSGSSPGTSTTGTAPPADKSAATSTTPANPEAVTTAPARPATPATATKPNGAPKPAASPKPKPKKHHRRR